MKSDRLFAASCIALVVTAMSFAIRGDAVGAWQAEFGLDATGVGWINGAAFWGFTLAMVLGGPLCDALGLRRIVALAFFGHVSGILLMIFAWNYGSLYAGTLIFGVANGSVEAACNPLIATLYPHNKTTKLNHFHVWFPGGIVIGGLLAYAFGRDGLGWGWRAGFGAMLLPALVYGLLFWRQTFPQTERVQQGVTTRAMFGACLNPLFLLMVVCMLFTATTELGPQNWIPDILSAAGVPGILVLVWITGLMAVGRQFAGPFVHRLSPMGMLVTSSILSAAGLFAMSRSSGAALFGAATLFAFGVCFFWPTMLGYVSERFPRTGAVGLAIMGGAGMLAVSFGVPLMGRLYDEGVATRLPVGVTADTLAKAPPGTELAAQAATIKAAAGLETLGSVALLPVILTVIFTIVLVAQKRAASGR
jgi:fucose permease